jgi:ribose 5-phosphate isomerase B
MNSEKVKIGIAADHGGFELKEYLKKELQDGFDVTDFGNHLFENEDDYPDYVIPMALAVAEGELFRGIAVCGSGVGACVDVNKLTGIRACLITDTFSAHQGVEDDNMNIICLGGRVLGTSIALEIVKTFLGAEFTAAERHRRRLSKVEKLENRDR